MYLHYLNQYLSYRSLTHEMGLLPGKSTPSINDLLDSKNFSCGHHLVMKCPAHNIQDLIIISPSIQRAGAVHLGQANSMDFDLSHRVILDALPQYEHISMSYGLLWRKGIFFKGTELASSISDELIGLGWLKIFQCLQLREHDPKAAPRCGAPYR